jgi:hypothetical protein
VDWLLPDGGWRFTDREPRCRPDPHCHAERLRDIYNLTEPGFTGRVTVPVLFDTVRGQCLRGWHYACACARVGRGAQASFRAGGATR